jgi:hypothetical protein
MVFLENPGYKQLCIHFFHKKLKNQKAGGTFTLLLMNKELSEYYHGKTRKEHGFTDPNS